MFSERLPYAPINVNPPPPGWGDIRGDLKNLYAYVDKKYQIPSLSRTGGGGE